MTNSEEGNSGGSDSYIIPVNRELSEDERALLLWLLGHGSPQASAFVPQISQTRVIGLCPCGCPSIDLSIDGKPRTTGVSQILADYKAQTPEGVQIGIILHAREGKLSELELYTFADENTKFSLPPISTLKAS